MGSSNETSQYHLEFYLTGNKWIEKLCPMFYLSVSCNFPFYCHFLNLEINLAFQTLANLHGNNSSKSSPKGPKASYMGSCSLGSQDVNLIFVAVLLCLVLLWGSWTNGLSSNGYPGT